MIYEHADSCMSIRHDGQQTLEPCDCHAARILTLESALRKTVEALELRRRGEQASGEGALVIHCEKLLAEAKSALEDGK